MKYKFFFEHKLKSKAEIKQKSFKSFCSDEFVCFFFTCIRWCVKKRKRFYIKIDNMLANQHQVSALGNTNVCKATQLFYVFQ